MNKKYGFSLVEALIVTLIVSSALAASLPTLTTKAQKNDKSLTALGIHDPRYWKRTKVTGDNIYYNGTIGISVSKGYMEESADPVNRNNTLVLGQRTGAKEKAAITAYGRLGKGEDIDTVQKRGLIWFSKHGAFRAGEASGSQWTPEKLGRNSWAFGRDNIASGEFSKVFGGRDNTASGANSRIYAGQNNVASAQGAEIFAGSGNTNRREDAQIYAGTNNTIESGTDDSQIPSIIAGGSGNTIKSSASSAVIFAGNNKTVSKDYDVAVGQTTEKIKEAIDEATNPLGENSIAAPEIFNFNSVNSLHILSEFTENASEEAKNALIPLDEDGNESSDSDYITFIASDDDYLIINHNGVTETVSSSSDRRLKKDITPYKKGLKEILKVNPVSFIFKKDKDNKRYEGFIAQEIKKVYTETVGKNEKGFYELNYSELYYKIQLSLINASKELYSKITTLEEDSDKMTAEIEEMKKRLEKMEKLESNA